MEKVLDTREMEPPEPLERVLEALDQLMPGDQLRMIHRFEPYPLYEILEREGYRHKTFRHDAGWVEILIERPETS